jgi:hypothetical protein
VHYTLLITPGEKHGLVSLNELANNTCDGMVNDTFHLISFTVFPLADAVQSPDP